MSTLTPTQLAALKAINKQTHFDWKSQWRAKGGSRIQARHIAPLLREKLVFTQRYDNGRTFGHYLKITRKGIEHLETKQ